VLDPHLVLPLAFWLSMGVRAIDQCVETICAAQASAMIKDEIEDGLWLLIPGLLRCKADEGYAQARSLCTRRR
jgi:maleylacetate reductase